MNYIKILKIPVLDGQQITKTLRLRGGVSKAARDMGIKHDHLINILKSNRYRASNRLSKIILAYLGEVK